MTDFSVGREGAEVEEVSLQLLKAVAYLGVGPGQGRHCLLDLGDDGGEAGVDGGGGRRRRRQVKVDRTAAAGRRNSWPREEKR